MRLLIDTNIVLDVLMKRTPHFEDSIQVWRVCETGLAEGYLSALSFANLVYVMRKELTPRKILDVLNRMKLIFHFADFTSNTLTRAAELEWSDFEDAAQCATAEKIKADYIVTRNVLDYKSSSTPVCTPRELLHIILEK